MIWALVIGGLGLMPVGLVGLTFPRVKKPWTEPVPSDPIAESDAWEILANPIISYELAKTNDSQSRTPGFRRGLASLVSPQRYSDTPLGNTAEIPADRLTPAPVPPATLPQAPPADIIFTIQPGEIPDVVAERLAASGRIDDSDLFLDRLSERGTDTRLQVGTFTIQAGSSLDEVIDALTT